MADIYLEVEDYLWFTEYQQGNVNVVGLVFDDLIEETLDLGPEEVLTVYSDVVDETLGFADDPRYSGGQHWAAVGDTIAFAEIFGGSPIRVKQSVLNLVYTKPVMPIKIAHMHLDIVMSGSTTFMEEVSSGLQILSSYANAVPYYWDTIFETFSIDMTEPQPNAPFYLKLLLSVSDLVNMRHDVTQEYLFNSQCFEEFFVWEAIVWGWDKLVAESLINTDAVQEIIGKLADDYLCLQEELIPGVLIHPLTEEVFLVWDDGTHEKFFVHTVAEEAAFADALHEILGYKVSEDLAVQGVLVSRLDRYYLVEDEILTEDVPSFERYYIEIAEETMEMTDGEITFLSLNPVAEEIFNTSETAVSLVFFSKLASESLTFADIDSYVHSLIVEEGIDFGDVELTKWVFQVLIESGCDFADIIG